MASKLFSSSVVTVVLLFLTTGAFACPAGMVQIDQFCIDRYEASVTGPIAESTPGVLPTVDITQINAQSACHNAGKRLCTDVEWIRACKGPNSYTYPYGNVAIDGACNGPLSPDTSGSIAVTGQFSACVSTEGVYDMVGNVHEWTADPSGTFRGGYYWDVTINGEGCNYRTTAHSTGHRDINLGFRCCSDDISSGPTIVAIDIKPGSDPNSINLSSAGVVPVAILSTAAFDASNVDPGSISLAGASIKMVGKSEKYLCHEEDVNTDGLFDLVCQVYTAQFMIEEGETRAVLEAKTFDGIDLRGEDFIRIVPDY